MGTDTIVSKKYPLDTYGIFGVGWIEIWDFKFRCSFNDGPRAIKVFGIGFLGSEACTALKREENHRLCHVWFTFAVWFLEVFREEEGSETAWKSIFRML